MVHTPYPGPLLHTIVTCRFRVIFVQVFPCISLVILNILLFSAMRRAEQRRRRLTINRTNNNLKKNNAAKQKRGTVGRWLYLLGLNEYSINLSQSEDYYFCLSLSDDSQCSGLVRSRGTADRETPTARPWCWSWWSRSSWRWSCPCPPWQHSTPYHPGEFLFEERFQKKEGNCLLRGWSSCQK